MRVLQIGKYYPPVRGGIESHVRDLCEGLVANGCEVVCVVSSQERRSFSEKTKGVFVRRVRSRKVGSAPLSFSLPVRVRKEARGADVVHVHMPNPCAEVSCLLSNPKNLVVTYHADIVDKRGAFLYRPIQRMVLRLAKRIIVSSIEFARGSKVLEPFLEKCVVVPLGIDVKRFGQVKKDEVRSLRKERARPIFLFVGRFVNYKGLSYLLHAMKDVQGTLFLVGEGPGEEQLKREAALLGMGERVYFFNGAGDAHLPAFYHAADVFVLPSVTAQEAFGIVQLEAMACARPVISTRLGTGVEVVNVNGTTGLVVSPKNSRELKEAMVVLGSDAKLRARLGKNGFSRVRQHYTVEKMVRQVLKVYRSL